MSKKNRNKQRFMMDAAFLPNPPQNIMERHKTVEQYANDVYSKITREQITNAQRAEFISEASDVCVAVFARILQNDYGKLRNKETRLANMYHLFIEYYGTIGDELAGEHPPNECQIAAEKEFQKQTGFNILEKYRKEQ